MITEYIKHLTSIKGYSLHTATAYRKDLHQFASFINAHYKDARWSTISKEMVEHYIMTLVSYGELPTTTNRKIAAISGLYRYLGTHGHTIDNPAQYCSRRKVAETIPNTIDPEQLKAAYNNAIGTAKVMLGLLITTGMRIGELLAIRWEDINLTERTITIHGKGQKDRIVSVPERQLEEIGYAYPRQNPKDTIFHISQYETRCLIYKALLPYCQAKQLSPHAIRHTFATQMAKQGANAPAIAKVLGHRNIKTTQHYIDNAQMSTSRTCQIIKLY